MSNCALEQQGSCTKRWGYAAYGTTVGTGALLGAFELVKNDGTKYLLKVSDEGKLYVHPTTAIPIRLACPYKCTATEAGSGSIGANLVNGTKYQYSVVAVDTAGKTLGSHTIDAASGEVTLAASHPVTVVAYGVYGAATYEVYRRTYSGSWGAWGRIASALTHTSANGVTSVTWTDNGSVAPDGGTAIPVANTSEYTMSTARLVDFISVRKGGNNVALLTNGAGLIWCDGTAAGLIQPATSSLGGDPKSDNRLFDVTNSAWTVRGLHYHHRYVWGGDIPNYPQSMIWTDVDDYAYWPNNAIINTPDPAGGRILDFATKDDALVIGLTTGVWALWGSIFATTGPDSGGSNYFSKISDVGVASEWTMRNGPGGIIIYHGADNQPHYLQSISPVKEQVVEGKLVQQVLPTLKTFTDHANAFGVMLDQEYILAFPADKRVMRVYFFDTLSGPIKAPVFDDMPNGMQYLCQRLGGVLLGADDAAGQLWELYKSGQYTDNGTAITWDVKSGSLGCGADLYDKKFRRLFVTHKKTEDAYSTQITVYVDTQQVSLDALSVLDDAVYDTATYDTATYPRETAKTSERPINLRGRFAVVEFVNSSATERPLLYGFQFEHTPKRRPEGED